MAVLGGVKEVGYATLGQQTESNTTREVIGYADVSEQSIDTYSILGANSGVSTGDADTIYGINNPKIIANTSVINNQTSSGVNISGTSASSTITSNTCDYQNIRNFTLSDARGVEDFYVKTTGTTAENGLIMPKTGNYLIEMVYPTGASVYTVSVATEINNKVVHRYTGKQDSEQYSETFVIDAQQGDNLAIFFYVCYYGGASAGLTYSGTVTAKITAL